MRACKNCGNGECNIYYTFKSESTHFIVYCCDECNELPDIKERLKKRIKENLWKGNAPAPTDTS